MRVSMKKTVYLVFILALGVLFLLPFKTSANSPGPGTKVEVTIEQIPESCVYADLLVRIDSSHVIYTTNNIEYGKRLGLDEHAEIVTFDEDGFTSYTFHFRGAVSDNLLSHETGEGYIARFAYDTEERYDSMYSALNTLERISPVLKLALFDAEGQILEISDEFCIVPDQGYFLGYVNYSPADDSIHVSVYRNVLIDMMDFLLFVLIAGFLRILFSVAAETLIAVPFKLKPYRRIVVTNLITQIILTIAFAMSGFHYLITLIAVEAFVYIAEFIVYMILYKDVSRLKILMYTITANTVTLGFGLLLNALGIFKG
jgi:hypothetical protein